MRSNTHSIAALSQLWTLLAALTNATAERASVRPFAEGTLIDQQTVRHKLADAYFSVQLGRAVLRRLETESPGFNEALVALFARYSATVAPYIASGCVQLGGGAAVVEGSSAFDMAPRIDRLVEELLQSEFAAGPPTIGLDWLASTGEDTALNDHRIRVQNFVEILNRSVPKALEKPSTIRGLIKDFAKLGLFYSRPGTVDFSPNFRKSLITAEVLVQAGYPDIAVSMLIQANSTLPLLARNVRTEAAKDVLVGALSGAVVVSLAATEPTGGSDLVNSVQTTCVPDGKYFVLSGSKRYITNAPIADYAVVLARVPGLRGALAFNAFLVDMSAEGVVRLAPFEKSGLHRSPTGGFDLVNCRVHRDFLLGDERRAITYFTDALHNERALITGAAIAAASSAVRLLTERLKDTSLNPLLADTMAELVCARTFTWHLAEDFAAGRINVVTAAMAKARMPEMLHRMLVDLRKHFGSRFDRELMETWRRRINDARILSIFAGTSETMRELAGLRIRAIVKAGGRLFDDQDLVA